MNKSESLKNLATALHKAQGQIKHAVKDSHTVWVGSGVSHSF